MVSHGVTWPWPPRIQARSPVQNLGVQLPLGPRFLMIFGPSYTELNLFGLWVCVDMERRLIYNDITTLSIVE